jgi:polyhydroxyalkanoate synthase
MAVINPSGQVVPPASVLRGLDEAPNAPAEVLTYEGDRGPLLQHLGPLVAPAAHEWLWPRILDWAHRVTSQASKASAARSHRGSSIRV